MIFFEFSFCLFSFFDSNFVGDLSIEVIQEYPCIDHLPYRIWYWNGRSGGIMK